MYEQIEYRIYDEYTNGERSLVCNRHECSVSLYFMQLVSYHVKRRETPYIKYYTVLCNYSHTHAVFT